MYRWFYATNPHLALPLFALGFFAVFFAAVVAWVLLIKRPSDFAAAAALPLDPKEPRHG